MSNFDEIKEKVFADSEERYKRLAEDIMNQQEDMHDDE